MHVILLERIGHLGQMGDVVSVKNGYARNFLLPQKKALRATDENKKLFEAQRVQLEANNLERKSEAEQIGEKLSGKSFLAIRQAGDTGQLYGSVSTRDIAEAITAGGFSIERRQIVLNTPIKELGVHNVAVNLHPEVQVTVAINVARTEDEAERQAAGEDVTVIKDEELDIETFDPDAEERGYEEAPEADAGASENPDGT
ncbi:MAG: 50S ribosomal protein L9 [Alphaproteobacteria bacterium BRH_c36]|nr:MAG: 50S ribosomal protein L9 [Alphaproteobacteria bacterium BRH_c36]